MDLTTRASQSLDGKRTHTILLPSKYIPGFMTDIKARDGSKEAKRDEDEDKHTSDNSANTRDSGDSKSTGAPHVSQLGR